MDKQILSAIENSDIDTVQEFLIFIHAESIYKLMTAFGGVALTFPKTYNEKLRIVQNLINVIGKEETKKLITAYSRCTIYIPKKDRIINKIRDDNIYKEYYSGCSYEQLAQKYNMAARSIRNIIDRINGGKK